MALGAAACVVTMRTHAAGAAPLAWPVRIGNAAVACVTYVIQFFYPINLVVFYPYPVGGPPAWQVAGAIAILIVASAAAVICRRRCPYCFVGWFWYLGMLAPVAGLVQIADHAMADRYMYLPSIGLSVALAWGGARLAACFPKGRQFSPRARASRSSCLWLWPPGKRRCGATMACCGHTRWRVRLTMARQNTGLAKCSSKAAAWTMPFRTSAGRTSFFRRPIAATTSGSFCACGQDR